MAHSTPQTYTTKGSQGDVRFLRVPRATMPADAAPAEREQGAYTVAHSESGHHHVVDPTQAILYETQDPFVAYLVLADDVDSATVTHLKSGEHVHGPVTLKSPGLDWVWQVRRQTEWQPEGLRAAAD